MHTTNSATTRRVRITSLSRLHSLASDAARQGIPEADGATSALALYEPLSVNVERIYSVQHATDELASCCHYIHYKRRFPSAEGGQSMESAVQRLAQLTVSRVKLIQAMRTDLEAEARRVNSSSQDDEAARESEVRVEWIGHPASARINAAMAASMDPGS